MSFMLYSKSHEKCQKNTHFTAFVYKTSDLFQLPGDYGPVETKASPQSPQLLENINSFVQRWKDIVHNDRCVLTKDSIEKIEKLKVHILKGCLSGIIALLLPQDALLRPKSTQQLASKLSHYFSERCLFEQISQQTTN